MNQHDDVESVSHDANPAEADVIDDASTADDADRAAPTQDTPGPQPERVPTEDTPKRSVRQRIRETDRVQLAIIALIGLMMVVFVRGVSLGVTGDDRYQLGPDIESVSPVPDAPQVGPTQPVVIDLAAGFTGTLTIDGVGITTQNIAEIERSPGRQVDIPPVTIYEPGNATLTFRPQSGSPIESFRPGRHEVLVTYWPIVEGTARSRTYQFAFSVT